MVIGGGGRVAYYTDLDGDRVTITVSKGRLSADDFVMSGEGATVPGGEALVLVDFSDDGGEFNRADLTLVAKHNRLGGDGHSDVGFIDASGGQTDLGRVYIDGDLGQIAAGNSDTGVRSPGVKMLIAQDFGGAGGSDVIGGIAKLRVKSDLTGGNLFSVQPVGGITLSAGTFNFGAAVTAQTFTASGSSIDAGLVKTGAGSAVISGSGQFQPLGGTLQMSSVTTTSYSGSLTLNISGTEAASGVVVRMASVDPMSAASWAASLSSARTGILVESYSSRGAELPAGIQTFDASSTQPVIYGVSNTTSLIKTGSGTLNLGGSNVFTGGTLLTGGALTLGPSNTITGLTLPAGGAQLNIAGAILALNSGGTTGGGPNVATIELTNLDPATAPAGATKFEIEVGHNDVAIVQNRALFDSLIASGWVVGTPTFAADGNLASIKLTKAGPLSFSTGNAGGSVSAGVVKQVLTLTTTPVTSMVATGMPTYTIQSGASNPVTSIFEL